MDTAHLNLVSAVLQAVMQAGTTTPLFLKFSSFLPRPNPEIPARAQTNPALLQEEGIHRGIYRGEA